jgi:ATP-binding cassette subfamily G (WHITE) protein 2 (SNQ2)
MAYFGPANQAKQYFIDMGYEPANRQTTADFLVAVTDPLGRIERPINHHHHHNNNNNMPIPRTAAEFAAHFQRSPFALANEDDIASYRSEFVGQPKRAHTYIESVRAEHAEHTSKKSAYTISIPMQIRAVMIRQVQILYGNMMAQALQIL